MENYKGELGNLRRRWNEAVQFFKEGIWAKKPPPLFTLRGMVLRLLRFITLMVKELRQDDIRLHASSLTYSSLMSLVPILAMSLAVLKGLGYDDLYVDRLQAYTQSMPAEIRSFMETTLETVRNTNFARLGGIGAVILLWMAIQVLGRIEASFNQVWGIVKSRSWLRRATNYISVLVVVPLLLVTAVTVTARIKWDLGFVGQMGLLRLAPFGATWLAFFFLYQAMPNTRVRYSAAIIGGLIGAVMWHLWFRFYITLQPGVTRYNFLYGTLASVPIFLAWLYVSWLLVLFGAKLSFVAQTGASYQPEFSQKNTSPRARMLIALHLLARAVRSQEGEVAPLTLADFAEIHGAASQVVSGIVALLIEAGFLVETGEDPATYVLVLSARKIKLGRVADAVLTQGQGLTDLGFSNPNKALVDFYDRAVAGMPGRGDNLWRLLRDAESPSRSESASVTAFDRETHDPAAAG